MPGLDDVVAEEPSKPPEGEPNGVVVPLRRLSTIDSLDWESNRVKSMEGHQAGNGGPLATMVLAYQAIGVVYGDLGTSPLYVFSSTFPNRQPSKDEVLGVLSIIIYTITLISLIKYVFIVLQANDNGNGGAFALYSLICRHAKISVAQNQVCEDRELSSFKLRTPSRHIWLSSLMKEALQKSNILKSLLLALAMLGTCMVIGDGVITPSISVLSAIEGIKIAVPSFSQNAVVGVTCAILMGLFSLQRFGTDKVGYMFSPVVLLWFFSIGAIGVYNIAKHGPEVLKAFNPYYLYVFFKTGKVAWTSLGGVVLCITGTEAMFADLGHFSVRAIQISFSAIVYPCLLCAYIGQAGYLMTHPENVSEAFYKSIPDSVYWPMFAVATGAAVIASQAMISATFSIVYQAMNLGCFPRVKVVHTSSKYSGQVYIPEMNWLIMVLCLIISVSFRDTSQIGNAYGVAVNGDMVITTHLVTLVMIMIWQRPLWLALIFYCSISSVELLYFSSVLLKVPQGGYVPLLFVIVFFSIMATWYYGRTQKYQYEIRNKVPMDWVMGFESDLGVARVPGVGLVYTELGHGVPTVFHHLISKVRARHSVLAFVCLKYLPVSHVPDDERFLVRRVGPRELQMYRCAVRFGYRDSRKPGEDSESFENLLVQSLVNFIMAEHRPAPEPILRDANSFKVQIEGTEPTSLTNGDSHTDLEEELAVVDIASSDLEEELAILDAALQSGIVYLLGHTGIQARKDASWLKKLVINYGFHILKHNCRSSRVALSVPHASLLQVGMIHDI